MTVELVKNVDDDPSGDARAREAYAAGAVVAQSVTPTCEVSITFRIRGDRARANALANRVALELLAVPGIEPNVITMAAQL